MNSEETKATPEAAGNGGSVILDLGKHSKKEIKRLRRGKGKLLSRSLDAVEQLRESGQLAADAQPVILVVREKPKKGIAALFKA